MNKQSDPPPVNSGSGGDDWIKAAMAEHEGALLRYAHHFVHDFDTARDIVQDTFLKLCRQDQDEMRPKLVKWLFTVCRNRAIDIKRKESRMKPSPDYQLEERPDASPDAERQLVQKEAAAGLLQHVASLPDRQQEILRLKFNGGLSYRQIADVTGLTVTNVGVILHTAIGKLRKQMVDFNSA